MGHMLHTILTYGWILGLQLEVNKVYIHTHTHTHLSTKNIGSIDDAKENV